MSTKVRPPRATSSARRVEPEPVDRTERTRRRFVITAAVGVGFVAVLLLFAFVFPTRTFVGQRQELSREQERLGVLEAENQKLAERAAQLQTDAEVERIAREQFNMVRPDEEAYAILPPTTTVASPPPSN